MDALVHADFRRGIFRLHLRGNFTCDHPLVDLRVFKNRNFTVGLILMTSLAAILYGTTAQLPLFLQTLMGYPALQSGYALSSARRRGVFHDLDRRAAGRENPDALDA